jgi:glutaredoxin-like protein
MALLNDEIVQNVKQMLADLPNEVKLLVYTTQNNCDYCKEIVQLAEEVAATSDKVVAEVNDFNNVPPELNITMSPSIAIVGAKDYGIRYYGIPSGHEFSTLLAGIQKASLGQAELDDETKNYLAGLDEPVNIKVFVTPTCPYCPRSAILAYDMAVASDKVIAEVVESMEFQSLSMKHNVMGVPLSVINDKERVEGAAPPQMMVNAIKTAIG